MSQTRLTIVQASAGSGKTYALVLHYLQIALMQPAAFNEILAITFTNKATQEMKSRIIEALHQLSRGERQDLIASLKDLTRLNADEIIHRSGQLLAMILHRYSDLAVMTIDSFFYRLIRTISRELGIALNRTVELDTDTVIQEVKHALIMEVGVNEMTTRWLEQLVASKMETKESWHIDSDLSRQIKEILASSENFFGENKKAIDWSLINQIKNIRKQYEQKQQELADRFFQVLTENNLQPSDLAHGKGGGAGWFMKIKNGEFVMDNPGKRVSECLTDARHWTSRHSPHHHRIIDLARKYFIPLLQSSVEWMQQNRTSYVTATAVLEVIYLAGLAAVIERKLKEYRDEKEILLLSDVDRLVRGALTINDTFFIYEKAGNRFRHFLIDEFQDTSLMQWNNLLPLLVNGLSQDGQVFIVGDAKQSIYRWRGGRMELLLNGIQRDLNLFLPLMKEEKLTINFRSAPEIVYFNNRFFTELSQLCSEQITSDLNFIGQVYGKEHFEQKPYEMNTTTGYVKICLYEETSGSSDRLNKAEKRNLLLEHLWQQMQQVLNAGFKPGDIAILIRQGEDASLITSFLIEKGFTAFSSPLSLRICESDAVQLLVHAMKLLQKDDPLTRATCLHFFNRIRHMESSHFTFISAHDNSTFNNSLPVEFTEQTEQLKSLPLVDLVETLIRLFSLSADIYLLRFQDALLEFVQKESHHLTRFLQWWDVHADTISIILPAHTDAVRIMTIHKAKGLEFPVVMIPFADWDLTPHPDDILWAATEHPPYKDYGMFPLGMRKMLSDSFFADEYRLAQDMTLLDNINLMYVAFTRPRQHLYVSAVVSQPGFKNAAGLLQTVLTRAAFARHLKKENGNIQYEIGEIVECVTATGRTSVVEAVPEIISQPWSHRLLLAINPNRISVNDEPGAMQGLLFHQIMAEIITEDQLDVVLKKYQIGKEDPLYGIIERLLTRCRQYRWFSGVYDVKTECPLLLADGSVLRPDRLMISNDRVIILDYKTGEQSADHLQQLYRYAGVLTQAGFSVEKMFLYYTRTDTLQQAD
jgi:ATP-dependent exoDNAse (exonuclease V) beta subunit